ncbi:uncharacterized protein LOC125812755 [Solanum verrucosum]|uniref:uncharacterized protein LOC125812755 n=1 Tax=Solanum verrucosum TaxID=315347 RepID=UPI0020D12C20|nr:uncharacterized protein LOC125812755 [Solanum verrucosum]
MNTRRTLARRVEEEVVNEGFPRQGDQGLQGDQVPQEKEVPVVPSDMTNEEIRSAFLTLAQVMTAQVNRDVGPRVNANESTVTSKLRDFVRMNPPIFLGSRAGEDPQEFLDEVYKIVNAMGVFSMEKVEFASYQLKEVAQVWFTQWKANRKVEMGPIEWDEFKGAFLGKYFPREKRECKVEEFINFRQGNMSVEEYSLKFTLLSKYAPLLLSNPRDEMSRFVTGVYDQVKEQCRTTMLHDDMNISRLVVYAQSIKESKLKRVNRGLKRGGSDEQGQPRKRHHGKCLAGTSGCYVCGKGDHQVRNCPTLTTRGREAKQASYVGPDLDAPKNNRFYVFQANKDKGANPD